MGKHGKTVVVGAGWLGTKLSRYLRADLATTNITDSAQVRRLLNKLKPDVLVNTAGRAGPPSSERGRPGVRNNIDWCGETRSNRQMTWHANVDGPEVLKQVCREQGVRLVHFSSGCIFDGPSPGRNGWTERDTPAPASFYAETKVRGEERLKGSDALIIRLRMPVDAYPNNRNLITKLARYSRMLNELNSVTMVDSLLLAVARLVAEEKTGIYHVTNPGPVTHRQIMDWYREIVEPDHVVEFTTQRELLGEGMILEGRSNCVLDTSKLRDAGVSLDYAPMLIKRALRIYSHELRCSP